MTAGGGGVKLLAAGTAFGWEGLNCDLFVVSTADEVSNFFVGLPFLSFNTGDVGNVVLASETCNWSGLGKE